MGCMKKSTYTESVCYDFLFAEWEVHGNSEWRFVISNYSICETVSGMYGLGS